VIIGFVATAAVAAELRTGDVQLAETSVATKIATSGDFYLATRGYFFMATDRKSYS